MRRMRERTDLSSAARPAFGRDRSEMSRMKNAVMPIADVEAVAEPQRMVAARRRQLAAPRIGFAAGLVLSLDPPASRSRRGGSDRQGRGSLRYCRYSLPLLARYRHSGRRNRSDARRGPPSSISRSASARSGGRRRRSRRPPPNSAGPFWPSFSWLTIMMPLATRTLCECQPSGMSIRASSRGLRGSATS